MYTQIEIKKLISENKVNIGFKEVMRNIPVDLVRCVIISTDCSEYISNTVKREANKHNVEVIETLTKKELGELCEIDVSAAVVGILKQD